MPALIQTLSILTIGVSFRAKSRCPNLLETNKSEGNPRLLWVGNELVRVEIERNGTGARTRFRQGHVAIGSYEIERISM